MKFGAFTPLEFMESKFTAKGGLVKSSAGEVVY